MCNAWNHSPSCTCGWGGEGHAGRRSYFDHVSYSSSASPYWWVPPFSNTYESYVNPNARCPVCGALVFFYQSPSGGRVFFDELGPPWPKHPCTDHRSIPKQTSHANLIREELASSNHQYSWQKEGWAPFIVTSLEGIDKDFIKIKGIHLKNEINLYAHRLVEHHHHDKSISPKSVALARKISDSKYEISIIMESGIPLTFNSFIFLSEARSYHEGKTKIKSQNTPPKNNSKTLSKNKISAHENRQTKQPSSEHKNNAMRLAFDRAQKKEHNNS